MKCPTCKSDRTKYIHKHEIYLCFSCDDNFTKEAANLLDNKKSFSKKPGFWDRVHIYQGPGFERVLTEEDFKLEVHADGVKEVKCNSCSEPCGNEWCCMKDEQ